MSWFKTLWRKKSAPGRVARTKAAKEVMALHHTQGAVLRDALRTALKGLEDRRTLRDPETLERLLALAQAQRAMGRLLSGDLRRYLVLAGLRQWSGAEPDPQQRPKP
jgi:hypothetical protein